MLTHYIIVRRDLPLGVMAAMVTHAAGESGALYQNPEDGRFRGATAVVLEVKDERGLAKTRDLLVYEGIPHILIEESHGPYTGQWMAIGIVPCERVLVSELLKDYQTLKMLTKPTTKIYLGDDECTCPECSLTNYT